MFLDFAKAFDSVSRDYLLALLRHIGVPSSYCHIIRALFHGVQANPMVPGKTEVRIAMQDGLKQGCPLSPLFFILAIDPLLTNLSKMPGIEQKCFADDLAVGTPVTENIALVLPLVDQWSAVSHCYPNTAKTNVITTSPDPPALLFLPQRWREIQVVDTYVYLGILFGRSVDVNMVYETAMTKLASRVRSHMPIKNMFNLADRVRVTNTYFTPVLSYINRFFLMSEVTSDEVLALFRSWLIVGNSTTVQRLMTPTHACGLAQPLRDPSKVNLAAILRITDPNHAPLTALGTFSMRIEDHRAHGCVSYKSALATNSLPATESTQNDRMTALCHACPTPAEKLYATLKSREARHDGHRDPTILVDTVVSNSLRLPERLAPDLRNHLFNLVHNLIYTNHRVRRYKDPKGCAFCGADTEDYEHLFVNCEMARLTRVAVSHRGPGTDAAKSMSFLRTATEADFRLETPGMEIGRIRALIAFSLAMWRTRHLVAGKGAPSLVQASTIAAGKYMWLYKNWKGYKRRDRSLDGLVFDAVLRSLPTEAIHFYTDGSSYGNPGPAGSGIACYCCGTLAEIRSRSLGIATNNAAELDGIQNALAMACLTPGDLPIYIFVDNRLAIDIAIGRARPTWCKERASEVRELIDQLSLARSIYFFWVPGHADVAGNELADKAAKLGATGVTAGYEKPSDMPATSPPPPAPTPKAGGDPERVESKSTSCADCAEATRKALAPYIGLGPRRSRRSRNRRRRPIRAHTYNTRSRRNHSQNSQVLSIANSHIVHSKCNPQGLVRPGSDFPT